jgi:two-component system, LytTR family, response regulator
MTVPPLRVVVAEDEPLQRKLLVEMLGAESGIIVVAEAADGPAALEAIARHAPDLLFLDVQMPELDAFQVIEEIGVEHMPVTVFVTAYDAYAIKAFEVRALDYLLKPYDSERLHLAVRRAGEVVRQRAAHARDAALDLLTELHGRHRHAERLPVRTDGRILFLDTALIDWIEADGKVARFHLGKSECEARQSLSSVERQLDPARFVRVHRAAIVNVSRIAEMQPWFKGDYVIVLREGTRITTGRSYRDAVRRLLLAGGS